MQLIHDGARLARLKMSIGRDHAEPRPLFPFQVAEAIREMMRELDDPSGTETAKRLGVSTSLISDFVGILRTPPQYHSMYGWGSPVPWSAFRRAGPFLSDGTITREDFDLLASGVAADKIPASYVEEILYLKRKNPSKTIKECCKEILNLIPEKVRYVVFISDLDPKVADNLKRRAADGSISPDDLAESSLARSLGRENIKGVLIKDGRYIKIALTEQGRRNLGDIAEKEGVLLTDITNHLLRKNGPDCGQRSAPIRRHR